MQNIADNIRTLRKERGLTQEEVAAQLHVTRQTVSSWERGNSCPDFDTLRRLSEMLDASPEELLYGTTGEKLRKPRKIGYDKAVFASLLLGTLSFLCLEYIGLALYFAVLIPICTCAILDELRNGTYYQQFHRDDTPDEHDGTQI